MTVEALKPQPPSEAPQRAPGPCMPPIRGGLFDKQGNLKARESAWGQLLTSNGYAVLLPDSFGPRGVSSDCEGHVRAWAERSFDAYGALRYLQANGMS
jgi:hypothetical protein